MSSLLAFWRVLPNGVRWFVAAAVAYALVNVLHGALGLVLVLAMLAWAIVLLGYLFHAGRIQVPSELRGVLATLTARSAQPAAQGPQGPITAAPAAPAPALTAAQKEALKAQGIRQIDVLYGQDAAKRRIVELGEVASRSVARGEKGFGVSAPVQMVMFLGPSGTGKTKIAEAFASLLCGVGACTENKIVELRRRDVTDAAPGKAAEIVEKHAEGAIGGVLLIEDGGWLARGTIRISRSHPKSGRPWSKLEASTQAN
jgi:hypothetical protein